MTLQSSLNLNTLLIFNYYLIPLTFFMFSPTPPSTSISYNHTTSVGPIKLPSHTKSTVLPSFSTTILDLYPQSRLHIVSWTLHPTRRTCFLDIDIRKMSSRPRNLSSQPLSKLAISMTSNSLSSTSSTPFTDSTQSSQTVPHTRAHPRPFRCEKCGPCFSRETIMSRYKTSCQQPAELREDSGTKSGDEYFEKTLKGYPDTDDEVSVDKTFELNDEECEDDEESEDDEEFEDEIFTDIKLDNATEHQGNAVVHQSITDSVSAASVIPNRRSSLSLIPDRAEGWPSGKLKRLPDDEEHGHKKQKRVSVQTHPLSSVASSGSENVFPSHRSSSPSNNDEVSCIFRGCTALTETTVDLVVHYEKVHGIVFGPGQGPAARASNCGSLA